MSTNTMDYQGTDTRNGCLIMVGIAIFLMVCYGLCTGNSPEEKEKRKEDDNKVSAYVYAKQFVENSLVSPSTAKFAEMTESKVEKRSDNVYYVSGYLDAQNRFGAMVRMNYDCEITLLSDRGQVRNLHIEER